MPVWVVECGETSWELHVPKYHTKVKVYHVDAMKMAGLLCKDGQLPFGTVIVLL